MADSFNENDLIKRIESLENKVKKQSLEIKRHWDILKYELYSSMTEDLYRDALCRWYRRITGQHLNLSNPVTFNEKIQFLKLYDKSPLKTICADKYLVRDYVKGRIGGEYLIPLLQVLDTPDDLDISTLPERFVIKANHGSGWNIIVPDKKTINIANIKSRLRDWLVKNYAFLVGFELHYKDILPKILIEAFISDIHTALYDYRFYCFSGEPYHVWIDEASGTSRHKRTIRDLDFNEIDLTTGWPRLETELKRPDNFEQMIEISRILSKPFRFVRVDLYNVNNKIYFGELTFTPQSGVAKWSNQNYNIDYGNRIDISNLR